MSRTGSAALQAADVLQVSGLLQVSAARIASRIVSMSSDEKKQVRLKSWQRLYIRLGSIVRSSFIAWYLQLFGLPDRQDLNESEERALREEFMWAEELDPVVAVTWPTAAASAPPVG
jgi:hypothetical protein